jgi:Fe-S-cluster-containing hydrogenase component 2
VKCDLCDGDPKCVKYCSTEALVYEEETKEQASRRRDLAKKILSTS